MTTLALRTHVCLTPSSLSLPQPNHTDRICSLDLDVIFRDRGSAWSPVCPPYLLTGCHQPHGSSAPMGTRVILKLRCNPSRLSKALRHRLYFHLKFTGLYLKSRGRSINRIFSFAKTIGPEFNRGSQGGFSSRLSS